MPKVSEETRKKVIAAYDPNLMTVEIAKLAGVSIYAVTHALKQSGINKRQKLADKQAVVDYALKTSSKEAASKFGISQRHARRILRQAGIRPKHISTDPEKQRAIIAYARKHTQKAAADRYGLHHSYVSKLMRQHKADQEERSIFKTVSEHLSIKIAAVKTNDRSSLLSKAW